MTDRVSRMHSRIVKSGQHISINKYKYALDVEKQHAGEPRALLRAYTFAETMRRIPILIDPDELLVGNPASERWGLEVDATLGQWNREELDALTDDGYVMSEADKQETLRLNELQRQFGQFEAMNLAVAASDRLDSFSLTGVVLPPWKKKEEGNRIGGGQVSSGLGLGPGWITTIPDFEMIMRKGLRTLVRECDEALAALTFFEKDSFARSINIQAMRICLEGMIAYGKRCSDAALQAAAAETSPARRAELQKMAEICARVPENPPRDFDEALQFFWFIFMMVCPSPTQGLGRFDQYMYPYYLASKKAGAGDDYILERLEMLRVRFMEMHQVAGKEVRKRTSGGARWHNMVIAGVKCDGSDATNELSYLVLEAVRGCRTSQHTVTIRVAPSTPKDLLRLGVQCQAEGCSMPAFISDVGYIDYFTTEIAGNKTIPLEIARDFALGGCIEELIPGRSRWMCPVHFVLPVILDIFLNRGVSSISGEQVGHDYGDLDHYRSFEELFRDLSEEVHYMMSMAAERVNIECMTTQIWSPYPNISALQDGCIQAGDDVTDHAFAFEGSNNINPVGVVNFAQSLYGINTLVFEEKKLKLSELKAILDADWKGHEDLRRYCEALPHYGNDDDKADSFVVKTYGLLKQCVYSLKSVTGGTLRPSCVSITAHGPGGVISGASADGRHRGETLADANASPIRGTDTEGPLAVFKSAMKIDQFGYQSFLLNMKFHPSSLKTESDRQKLVDAIFAYLMNGGRMVQFTVASRADLEDAVVHPDAHADLLVRVAGYSAYFVNLTPDIQEDVIERTEQSFK